MTSRVATAITRTRTYVATYGVRAFVREALARARHRIAHPGVPDRFHVEISNTCNFNCEYCVLRDEATGDKLMSDSTFEAILPYLRDASSVALSGLAEPLMHRRFTEFLGRVREVAPRALISIDTNASLLTEPLAECIVTAGLDSLVFSLDGVDAELVDDIRQGGSLDTVVSRIQMLNDVKRRLGSDKPVLAATMVAQRKNIDQMPAVVRLAKSLGVKMLSVNGLEPYESDLTDEALWVDPLRDAETVIAAVSEAARVADEVGVEIRLPSPVPGESSCTQVGRPIVLADGTVVPCSVLAYRRERFVSVDDVGQIAPAPSTTDRVSFGNVNERPLEEIWTDPAYAEFRAGVLKGEFPSQCASCLMKHNVICANAPLTPARFIAAVEERAKMDPLHS